MGASKREFQEQRERELDVERERIEHLKKTEYEYLR